jgi:hypothetical protein
MTNPWEFFDDIIYINLPNRPDRNIDILNQFLLIDMPHFRRIDGIPNTSGSIHDGFNKAQRNALESAKGNAVIFEDDAIFDDMYHLDEALNELPDDWDILYFGGNVVGTDLCSWPVPEFVSTHLRRVTQCWTTHAIGYSEKGRKYILDNWDLSTGQMYDDFLRCNLEKMQAFIICPMICDQKKGYSDIWQRDVDYGFFNVWEQKR